MKSVPPPVIDYALLYRQAVQQTQAIALRVQLAAIEPQILAAGFAYDASMTGAGPQTVVPSPLPAALTGKVRALYEKRVQSLKGSCRWIYNDLFASLSHCPYCEYGEIYELDHYLPQSAFYDIAIYPKNLVPVCHPCNHKKLRAEPNGAGSYFLHPYFDQLPNIPWLFASLTHENGGPVLRYRVQLDPAVHGNLAHRLTYHFRELELAARMSKLSSKVLLEMETYVRNGLYQLTPAAISAHFRSEGSRIFLVHGNTVEAAANIAASENLDYCSGQFFS